MKAIAAIKRYVLNVLIGVDQLANTLIGGYPDETLSASAYRGELLGRPAAKFFRPLIDAIFRPIEKDHCRQAYESERFRAQSPDAGDGL